MGLETIFRLSVIMRMADMLSGPMRSAQVVVGQTNARLKALEETSKSLMKTGTAMIGTGAAMAGAIALPVRSTFETKRALGELASVGVKDMQALDKAATDFSNHWAGTTKAQFITSAYDIKSGISSLSDTGVAEYTRLAALTGKATKSTTAEMTSLFATGYGIYKDLYGKLSDEAFGQMFSGGIAASVKQFKTTGSGMAEAIQNLGASATSAKRPLEEQLTVLGMLQATMSGGEAGTKYQAFIQSAAKAGKELGLSFVDSKNQLLGVTDIVGKLRSKYGNTLDAIEKQQLAQAFGTDEAVDMIDLLYPKLDTLQGNIGNIRSAMKDGTAVTKEMATAMNTDPGSRWAKVGQQMHNLMEVMGNSMLPTAEAAMNKIGDLVTRLTKFGEENPAVAQKVGLLLTALAALITIGGGGAILFGSLGFAITNIVKPIGFVRTRLRNLKDDFLTLRIRGMYAADSLRRGFTTVQSGAVRAGQGVASLATSAARLGRQAAIAAAGGLKSAASSLLSLTRSAGTAAVAALRNMTAGMARMAAQAIRTAVMALPGLIAGVWSFTAALLANPITWIVLAIIALVAVIILLWRNWDKVTAAFLIGWQFIKNVFAMGKQWVVEGITAIGTYITSKFTEFKNSGAALLQAFVDGLKSMVMQPYEVVKGGLSKLRNLLPFSDAKEGPLSRLTYSGGALMTTFAAGIHTKQSVLHAAMSRALSGMELAPAMAGAGGGLRTPAPGLAKRTSLNIREIFREKSRESERVYESRRGPLVALHYRSGDRREAEGLLHELESWLARNK